MSSSYVIERIIEERVNMMGDLYARVKWQGYPDSYNSWILKSTLIDNSQEIEETDSQTDEDTIDRTNFISASDAVANILSYRSVSAYSYPDVVIDNYYFQKLDIKNQNYLLVWNFADHLYVICCFKGQVFLADGVDTCHLNSKARGLIRKYVSRKISLGSVGGQQSGDDHCGSSAVLIGLEYLRMMKNGEIQERILFPAGLKIKMIKKLHPNPNTKRSCPVSTIRENVASLICQYCQASYRSKGGARLKQHEAKCKSRPIH